MNNRSRKTYSEERRRFYENDFFIFFFGPIVFLILRLIGVNYSIFYSTPENKKNDPIKKRAVILLSLGALFYLMKLSKVKC